jgi:hypothetical protein
VGGFPVGVVSGEDLLTWARLACRYQIAWTKSSQAIYFTPTTGITRKESSDLKSIHDAVGQALQLLMKEFPNSNVRVYVAFWYKMRGIVNLKYYNRWAAVKSALKSISYCANEVKPWLILVLALLPKVIIAKCLSR